MRKRAVGESYPYAQEQPSSMPLPVGSYASEAQVPSEPMPNSPTKQLPELVAHKSLNYTNPSSHLIHQLLQEPIASACQRLNLVRPRTLPTNDVELRAEIDRFLKSELPEKSKERLRIIQMTLSRCRFAKSLELYERYIRDIEDGVSS